jgi:hypothetical protein
MLTFVTAAPPFVTGGRLVRAVGPALFIVAIVALAGVGRGAAPAFYRDDPIETDDDRAFDALGEEVRRRVLEKSGIRLDWEIRRLGVPA